MSDKLLTRDQLAALFGTSADKAASILTAQGVQPIFLPRGKYQSPRWLESAVIAALHSMHAAAQISAMPKAKASKKPRPAPSIGLSGMTANNLHKFLTQGQSVQ